MQTLVKEVQLFTNCVIKLTSANPQRCALQREKVFLKSGHPSGSVISDFMRATCVFWQSRPPPPPPHAHSHTHIQDNASLHIQGRVTIGYCASQPCRAHNERLHQQMHSLTAEIQMGVWRVLLRHLLLPSHYAPASYFHDACFHFAPVKVHPPPRSNIQAHRCF